MLLRPRFLISVLLVALGWRPAACPAGAQQPATASTAPGPHFTPELDQYLTLLAAQITQREQALTGLTNHERRARLAEIEQLQHQPATPTQAHRLAQLHGFASVAAQQHWQRQQLHQMRTVQRAWRQADPSFFTLSAAEQKAIYGVAIRRKQAHGTYPVRAEAMRTPWGKKAPYDLF
ncbi:hypothetical protein [Hymenobacter crusticola]|uniref:Uncharacterized protein n=1 Tax=Hymenobacter crusticola TaxID=1770526 RepID=A0A243W5Y0_9BACT|nr:hypothetical protein [Hymenobacter crusticola]OUJ69063.1 hypothetical protein BXP70_27000 [Hymenobacter crusticola]